MRESLLSICIVLCLVFLATGCGRDETYDEAPARPDATTQPASKSLEDYRREAEQEITSENAEAELGRLEREIEAEAGE